MAGSWALPVTLRGLGEQAGEGRKLWVKLTCALLMVAERPSIWRLSEVE